MEEEITVDSIRRLNRALLTRIWCDLFRPFADGRAHYSEKLRIEMINRDAEISRRLIFGDGEEYREHFFNICTDAGFPINTIHRLAKEKASHLGKSIDQAIEVCMELGRKRWAA